MAPGFCCSIDRLDTSALISSQAMPLDEHTIAACATCVTQSAEFFDELRTRCVEMRQQISARDRGYFTPAEDETVRQALVSYWNAREALRETISQIRSSTTLASDDGPRAFLIAYAAGILLVDAARFMRDAFGDSSIVMAKLNEAEPAFGIPAGVFSEVQKSLTDPANVWHLYHAREYFTQNRDVLCQLADDHQMQPLLAIADLRGDCLSVGSADYARARIAVRLREVQGKLKLAAIEQGLFAIQKAMGLLASELTTKPQHRPGVPDDIYNELSDMLEPGDVIVVRKEHAVTNYFLPGYWPHAALYLGDGEELEQLGIALHEPSWPNWRKRLEGSDALPNRVLEALKDGVRLRSLKSPLASDAVAVVRPTIAPADIARALARGLKHEGKPYDFDFDFKRSDRMVCTEVVYRSYDGVGDMTFPLTRRAGRMTLSAEDILCMALRGSSFKPVAVYAPGMNKSITVDNSATELLRETLKHLKLEDAK